MSTLFHGTSSPVYSSYTAPTTRSRSKLAALTAHDQRSGSQQLAVPPAIKPQVVDSVNVNNNHLLTSAANVTREITQERDTFGDLKAWQVSHKDFENLQTFLSSSRLRYDYNYHSKQLIVQFPTDVHETAVNYFSYLLNHTSKKEQRKPGGTHEDPWVKGTNLEMIMVDSDGKKASNFIPDFAFSEDTETPLLILEVAWSQDGDDARKKVEERMEALPSLHGAIVIDFKKSAMYRRPDHIPISSGQYIDRTEWKKSLEDTEWGPFKMLGHTWVGTIECTFDIYARNGTDVTHEPQLAVIPILGNTTAFDHSLSNVWRSIVKAKMPEVEPEALAVDWDEFRNEVKAALFTTGYNRFAVWRGLLKRRREGDNEDVEPPSRKRRVTKGLNT